MYLSVADHLLVLGRLAWIVLIFVNHQFKLISVIAHKFTQLKEEFEVLTLANDASRYVSLTDSWAHRLLMHSASPLKHIFPHHSTWLGRYFPINFDEAASPSRPRKYTVIVTFLVDMSVYQLCGVRRIT